ncbi:non-hydrolyzing UDP-N-acetylglucosamine 2-epimerase [Fusobacterium mortiferum]|uniref:UDP-N-acetylglucosamine 2-epimerase (Non-hydrolyzing) n=1 Tax=Fusobacterium mortiferum ATCC 9817 TaxID=469616 RepID=A0ABN5J772_FUSMR|nr:UDP-N-acetylglucosamine 2-epimerase (non-hydrolyzing) [Fusobacterium mortiferum]AVQ17674.1 UDP-N-acetylglucosamine 2-epimerase (non-hydrolyzing) [Fusobacterium mortiferum ATCC 9817]EEO35460.1 UDP-N-acetylglucosamine 2-epimerase [Fusobacterium mortiferum ATCC 9817]
MEKLKLMTILGTRPEIIRLSEIIKKADKYFDHILVHTGQNWDYTLNKVFFDDLELREPDYYLGSVGNNLGETIGNIIAKSYEVLLKEKPDALLLLGDTNSALSAIAAKRLKVPIFHMEAGNRCFDQNLPEEINRKIVDHISDINLPYTENSRRYLLSEGFRKEHVFVTGSPMTEVLEVNKEKIEKSNILTKLNLEKNKYILLSTHREENVDNEKNFNNLVESINSVAEKYQMPIIFSVHPRTQKKLKERNIKFNSLVRELKPFGFFDYCNLQENSFCVLSDSGTLSEESAILKFPAISIRTSTERPEVIDKGNIILAGIKKDEILSSLEIATEMFKDENRNVEPYDYLDNNVSDKVIKVIRSYTNIVNRVIWGKNNG